MLTSYLVGMALVHGAFALRSPHESSRNVFLISLFWPISLLMLILVLTLTVIGWDMDMAKGTKAFSFRRPTNPNVKGFAVTVLYQEFQFFSVKKV